MTGFEFVVRGVLLERCYHYNRRSVLQTRTMTDIRFPLTPSQ